jgi:hypothetical protein
MKTTFLTMVISIVFTSCNQSEKIDSKTYRITTYSDIEDCKSLDLKFIIPNTDDK